MVAPIIMKFLHAYLPIMSFDQHMDNRKVVLTDIQLASTTIIIVVEMTVWIVG